LVAQGEELDVYDVSTHTLRPDPLVPASEFVNGPPCFIPASVPGSAGRFVEADDNPNDHDGFNGEAQPFFGVFTKDGTRDFTSPFGIGGKGRIGFNAGMTDPAGCAFDAKGNLFGVDVGNVHAPAIGDGKLIEFFAATNYTTFCVLDPTLSQPGMVAFDEQGRLYVPEAGSGKIDRYSGFGTDAAHCGTPTKELWSAGLGTPIGIVRAPQGGWAVSSVLVPSGVFHVNDLGIVDGTLVAPAPNTGTPFGLAYDNLGDLFYADLGVKVLGGGEGTPDPTNPIDSAPGAGGFRWVPAGSTLPVSQPIATQWDFPDGVTVVNANAIRPQSATPVTCDWPTFGHDIGRSFSSPDSCSTIDKYSASTLKPKWRVDTGHPVTAQPAIVNNRVYVGDFGGKFYSVDAGTGAVKWTFDVNPSDQSTNDYGKITSSAAVTSIGNKQIVLFGGGATLYALDAADSSANRVLSKVCVDPKYNCGPGSNTVEIESSPAVVTMPDGTKRVLVGMDFNEAQGVGRAGVIEFALGGDGSLTPLWKYDPETNQTYTGPGLLTAGGAGQGCGNVWSSPAVDGARNTVTFGIGNCDVPSAGVAEATIAITLDTGTQLWRNQPRDPTTAAPLDLDFGATPNELPGGRVGEGGKDGLYYAFDQATGAGSAGFPSKVSTASDIGGMIGSTAVGKALGQKAVFASSAFPVSTRDSQTSLQDIAQNPGLATGLHAIDASTGQKLWDAPTGPAYGAAVYAGGVVFVPDTFTNTMQGFDASTGHPVWAFSMVAPPSSPPAIVGNSLYAGSGTDVDGVGAIWGFSTTP
jgi:polyvinyl alcohol dehydrogenase (cytochrome)